jgi:hypothetical protein
MIRNSCVVLFKDLSSGEPHDIMLIDYYFKIDRRDSSYYQHFDKKAFTIKTFSREMTLWAKGHSQSRQWVEGMERAFSCNPWAARHEHDSFAPSRMDVNVPISKNMFQSLIPIFILVHILH